MAYVALYRKWRPGNFESLVGQDHISKTLANAIKTGKIAHAYLFSGPRGTGKTSCAKILAKALNCGQEPTPSPCNECASCTKINAGSSMDVFEIDAASNRGIDEIRDLRETVKFAPVDGRYKVYIIDEVHMLTTEAFNALLKTLEEPPSHVVFILATTEAQKVPATIHSRCQRYDFKRIGIAEITCRLELVLTEMQVEAQPEALRLIAAHADGGLRDALSILDQCSALDEERITVEKVRNLLGLVGHEWIWKIVDCMAGKNTQDLLLALDELIGKGKDVKQILTEIVLHMRSVMIYQAAGDAEGIAVYSDDKTILAAHSQAFAHQEIAAVIQKLHGALSELKWSPQPRITMEVALLSLCDEDVMDAAPLLARLERLEEQLARFAAESRRTAAPQTVLRQMPPVQPAPEAPPLPQPTQAEHLPQALVAGDATALWEQLLKTLVQNGKRSIYACVSQGRLCGFSDGQMLIAFTAAFPKERTEKNDYREILESTLRDLCGRDIAVRCSLESAAPPRPKPSIQKKPVVSTQEQLTPEGKQVMDAAVQVFGDDFAPAGGAKK